MSDVAGVFVLIGRILFVVFPAVVSGYRFHLRQPKAAEGYAQSVGFPVPALAGIPAGLWLEAASLSIAFGIWPDIGALMLAAFMVPAAWWFHRYWTLEDPGQKQVQNAFFFRNLIIFGACLIMFGFFASVDEGLRFTVTDSLINLR